MAAEGEFAFVIAVFAVDNELISQDIYASVVLAVLISTIIPPFLLRFTIGYYNKKAEEAVQQAVKEEMKRNHDLESVIDEPDHQQVLEEGIRNKTAVFLCIQTQSESSWGLMHRLMGTLAKLGLEVIDHRAWSPRGVTTTLVNEIYVKDTIEISKGGAKEQLEIRVAEISKALMDSINQPDVAKVKVQRWYPGVVEEYTETVDEDHLVSKHQTINLEQRLLEAATAELERKQAAQVAATHEKSVEQILKEMGKDVGPEEATTPAAGAGETGPKPRGRRRRQKMRSTPVVGGGLFGEGDDETSKGSDLHDVASGFGSTTAKKGRPSTSSILNSLKKPSGHAAEIIVDGDVYKIRINDATLKNLREGYSGEMMDSRGISVSGGMQIQHDDVPVITRLQGYIRNTGTLGKIAEDEPASETSDAQKESTDTPCLSR